MIIHDVQIDEDRVTLFGTVPEPLAENVANIRDYLNNYGYAVVFAPYTAPPTAPAKTSVNAFWQVSTTGTLIAANPPRHIIRFGPAADVPAQRSKPLVNIVLFLLTVLTTLTVGALQQGGNPFFIRDLALDPTVSANYWRVLIASLSSSNPLQLGQLLLGMPFSFALVLILGSHELGHYLTARRYGVDATLPYFLPIPHPLLGTMGAFIRIKSPIPDRRALIRLGVAGPIVGFVVALPLTIVGLMLSHAVPAAAAQDNLALGSSLLFGWLSRIVFPNLPAGWDVALHPLAFAGWLGFFVTALNLMPMGQLDGGHIAYVALGHRRRLFQFFMLAVMLLLGFRWPGWFFWAILIVLLGLGHPPTLDEITPISRADKVLMLIGAVILILTFMPVPFPITR